MDNSVARKNILDRISAALQKKTAMPFPGDEGADKIFAPAPDDLAERFANRLSLLRGKVIFCSGVKDVFNQLEALAQAKQWSNVVCRSPSLLHQFELEKMPFINAGRVDDADAGVTDCELLIARTGTVLLSSAQPSGRILPVRVPAHVVIAHAGQLVYGMSEAIERMRERFGDRLPSALFFASGPSRTGDIERTLVLGVHGPGEVYVFLMNDKRS
jgi:L-lactate dehydrogenase complex protein LldG